MLRDIHRARDAVQETFLRLCSADLKTITPYIEPWLFRVCRSRVFDVLRKETPMETREMRESGRSDDPSAAAEARETESRIAQAIRKLPSDQQDVIRLKFQQGLKYKEISRITDKTVGNVGFLIHTALKKIRSGIDSELQGGAQ